MALEIKSNGGIFRGESFVYNQTIAAGQTGDLVIIGTAGKITKLTFLLCQSTVAQAGISVDIDGNTVIPIGSLGDSTPISSSDFSIFKGVADSVSGSTGSLSEVTGEFITIKKDAGNTAQIIVYSYVTGVLG